jgi:hypothetical protein
MYIAKLKDGPKRAMKLSQIILERLLKMVWWRGRKWTHVKGFWSWDVLSSQNVDTLGASLFLPLFQYLFSLSFNAPSLWGLVGILMINEETNTLKKFLFRWNGMEWLSCDYGNGGVVEISVVDTYFRLELCTPILLGEASKNFDGK